MYDLFVGAVLCGPAYHRGEIGVYVGEPYAGRGFRFHRHLICP